MKCTDEMSLINWTIVKLIALNAKGLTDNTKVRQLIAFLREQRADLAILGESHLAGEKQDRLKQRFSNIGWVHNCPKGNAAGITIAVLNPEKIPLESVAVEVADAEGRILGVSLNTEGKTLRVMGIYGPNPENESVAYYEGLREHVERWTPHVIAGDFNKVPHARDRNPPRGEPKRVVEALSQVFEGKGYIDGWRKNNPTSLEFTYWSSNELYSASRIDRVYVLPSTFQQSAHWGITYCPNFTDHAGVTVEINPGGTVEIGKGQWMLSLSALGHKAMDTEVESYLDKAIPKAMEGIRRKGGESTYLLNEGIDPKAKAEDLAAFFHGLRQTVMRAQKRLTRLKSSKLEKARKRVKWVDTIPRTRKNARRAKVAIANLQALEELRAEDKSITRSERWGRANQSSKKDFWRLGRAGQSDRLIRGLYNAKGKVRRSKKGMLKAAKTFYKDLFKERKTSEAAQDELIALVQPADFSSTSSPVDESEVWGVIKSWKKGTCPGIDGLRYELFDKYKLYKVNEFTLVSVLTAWVTLYLEYDKYGVTVTDEVAQGAIRIMHKKGDKLDLANYRPLTMTNSITKLLTGVINNRLMPIFQECIGPHQTGFMPGRSIFDNIKLAQSAIDVAQQRGSPLFMIFLDQVKAYDRVDYKYLWKILWKYGVPEGVIGCIRGLYEAATNTVNVNGFETDPFPMEGGVRQGDPLSCLLFNAAIEPLARLIELEPKIDGLKDSLGNVHKVMMYADDTTAIATKLRAVKALLRRYKVYAEATGADLNIGKTEILAVVPEGYEVPEVYHGIRVVKNGTIKYLGIPVGVGVKPEQIWKDMAKKIQKRVERWEARHLSRWTRVRVAATVLESTLWHHLRCLPARGADIEMLQRVIFRYVWKRPPGTRCAGPIRNLHALRNKDEGGLGLLDIGTMHKALALSWIKALEQGWKNPTLKPVWYDLMVELFLHNAPQWALAVLDRPWVQQWRKRESYPISIQHFWQIWKDFRVPYTEPGEREELLKINFWFHPTLYNARNGGIKWHAPCWRAMLAGNKRVGPVKSIKDLLDLEKSPAPQSWKSAAVRIRREFRESWQTLIGTDGGAAAPEEDPTVQDNGTAAAAEGAIPVDSNNKARYIALLSHSLGRAKEGRADLLRSFRSLCLRDGISLHISDKNIWRMTTNDRDDYPPFQDLYWALLIGKLRTGEPWMPNDGICPCCDTLQTAEHLFWKCPLAQVAWGEVQRLWGLIDASVDLAFPTRWAGLLLTGYTHTKGQFKEIGNRKRWRALFTEMIWSLWVTRCEWSFGEVPDITVSAILRRFRHRIRTRVLGDRLRCLDSHQTGSEGPDYWVVWNRLKGDLTVPDWL